MRRVLIQLIDTWYKPLNSTPKPAVRNAALWAISPTKFPHALRKLGRIPALAMAIRILTAVCSYTSTNATDTAVMRFYFFF